MKYADYKDMQESVDNSPVPIVPKWLYAPTIRKTGDKRQVFGKWINLYAIDFAWCIPARTRYVERYHLEFLSEFRGWAKIRRLHVWTLFIWPFHKLFTLRCQSQEKIQPIEGTWYEK